MNTQIVKVEIKSYLLHYAAFCFRTLERSAKDALTSYFLRPRRLALDL